MASVIEDRLFGIVCSSTLLFVDQCREFVDLWAIWLVHSHLPGVKSPLAELLHALRIARPVDGFLFGLAERFRVQVVSALGLELVFFDRDAILPRECVVADACHLPTDFDIWRAGLNAEAITSYFFSNDRLSERTNDR